MKFNTIKLLYLRLLVIILLFFGLCSTAQRMDTTVYTEKGLVAAKRHQDSLNEVYLNPKTTILPKKMRSKFKGLTFYPLNSDFCVRAHFERIENPKMISIATSTGVPRKYREYGKIIFELGGASQELVLYQNPLFRIEPDHPYRNHLLLGFTDYTSGDGSYAGGRYLDILTTDIKNDTLILDFNKAYNPYCAYTEGYSCAIPPAHNDITVRVAAGVSFNK